MGFNIMDLMNGATRAAVEGVDNYEAITLVLIFVVFLACTRSVVPGINTPFAIIRVRGE